MEKSIGKTIKRDAFEMVSQFATMSQLRHHRNRAGLGMSFRTSQDASNMLNDMISRKSYGDNMSNILRPGLIKSDKSMNEPSVTGF